MGDFFQLTLIQTINGNENRMEGRYASSYDEVYVR